MSRNGCYVLVVWGNPRVVNSATLLALLFSEINSLDVSIVETSSSEGQQGVEIWLNSSFVQAIHAYRILLRLKEGAATPYALENLTPEQRIFFCLIGMTWYNPPPWHRVRGECKFGPLPNSNLPTEEAPEALRICGDDRIHGFGTSPLARSPSESREALSKMYPTDLRPQPSYTKRATKSVKKTSSKQQIYPASKYGFLPSVGTSTEGDPLIYPNDRVDDYQDMTAAVEAGRPPWIISLGNIYWPLAELASGLQAWALMIHLTLVSAVISLF
ncbi:hypothetical protein F5Y11DRAFT_351275 [Daldinia sp. FL1419]|nr:hypothetical protein F5Y11DRAFT_351275 [Daldinia sp. FL1419]